MKHKKKKAPSDRKQPISKSEIEYLRCLAKEKLLEIDLVSLMISCQEAGGNKEEGNRLFCGKLKHLLNQMTDAEMSAHLSKVKFDKTTCCTTVELVF